LNDQAWLRVFQEISASIRTVSTRLFGTERGRQELQVGAGGDTTVEIDRAAEAAAIAILERVCRGGERFSLQSEEAGQVDFGAPFPLVVLDPIDGSLNAKQGVPCFAVMLSLAEGPLLGDLVAGYTLNLVNGETWTAIRGGGASHRDEPLIPLPRHERWRLEIVGLESSPRSVFSAERLLKKAGKLRILGSVAISLAQAAAGSFDIFCSPMRSRVFDLTAGALLIREVGGVITDMAGGALEHMPIGLDVRTTLLAASDPDAHRLALRILGEDAR
jgi:myo-inositol-1(or 4)-monophosphatase